MLELKNISLSVEDEFTGNGQKEILRDVSLTIETGKLVVVTGPNGGGKSTMAKMIAGILKPNQGQILLDGEDLLKADKKRIREIRGGIISYVPQGGGASMNPLLKVGFQVGEPLMEHRGYSKKAAEKDSVGLLKRFNVGNEEKIAKAYPHMLSGGMRQRAMVAMGISAGPRIILADEPTKGLDERRIRMVADALNQLKEETLLCVTHDMKFAKAVGDKISVMYAAQQLEYGTAAQVLEHPLHPYTQALISNCASIDLDEKREPIRIEGEPPSPVDPKPCCPFAGRCFCEQEICRREKP